jgi:hypothetical protein
MKYGYYEDGALIKPINYFIAGAHILVVCSPTDYSSKIITLENVGWEVRDSIKVLLKNKSLQVGVLRKPFKGTVANNVLTNGCGGLNIDACRIGHFTNTTPSGMARWNDFRHGDDKYPTEETVNVKEGRFPANLLLDLSSANMMDSHSGISNGNGKVVRTVKNRTGFKLSGSLDNVQAADAPDQYGDSGGASRFFYKFKSELDMKSYLIKLVIV